MSASKDRFAITIVQKSGDKLIFLMQRYNGHNVFVATDVPGSKVATPLPPAWEAGILEKLRILFETWDMDTSTAVLTSLNASGKRLLIIPERTPGFPGVTPTKVEDATPKDEQPYACDWTKNHGDNDPSTWQPCKVDPAGTKGTGLGSDALLEFTAANHEKYKGPGSGSHEILLHEMVHAVRVMHGVSLDAPIRVVPNGEIKLFYETVEEFLAILVANVYRSENHGIGLRADHLSTLGKSRWLEDPLTDPENYYQTFKTEIDKLMAQPHMSDLFKDIARVECRYNPIHFAVFRPFRPKP